MYALMTFKDQKIEHLTEDELNRLTLEFENYYEEKQNHIRAKHYIIFLLLRCTGARISEVINITERDFDFKNSTVRLKTLKRRKEIYRIVPVPDKLISEYLRLSKIHTKLTLKCSRITFFKVFQNICSKANIPAHLRHPHVLRHTRAIELLRAGVPVTAVQQLLGHASITVTAMYLRFSNVEIQQLLRMKNLI